MKKRILFLAAVAALTLGLVSCASKNKTAEEEKSLIFGFSPGPYSDLFKHAIKPGLEKKGYKIKMVELTDWVTPNLSLGNGEIDANIFQHTRYLKKFSDDKGLDLSPVIAIPTASLGLYSHTLKATGIDALKAELKPGETLAVPNDPTNLARALIFLRDLGLLTLKAEADATQSTEKDIAENPFQLKILPIDAAQLPRSLDGTTLAVISGNYAISAGIKLSTAIANEHLVPETENVVAVRTADLDKQWVADVIEIIESENFKNLVEDTQYDYASFQRPQWYVTKWSIPNH
jgi:D-methionine transport system substrate-binding protein